MILICENCGHTWDDEDSCNCPNCGSLSTREYKENEEIF